MTTTGNDTQLAARPGGAGTLPSAQELRDAVIEVHGVWDEQWEAVLEFAPELLAVYAKLAAVPHRKAHLDAKTRELMYLVCDLAVTHLHAPGVREHIRRALELGATPGEITEIIQLTTPLGIHAMNYGVPLLAEVLEERGEPLDPENLNAYQKEVKERFVSRRGYWHYSWDQMLVLDPEMFDAYVEFSSVEASYSSLEPKVKEFVYTAFDSSTTHLYGKGLKLHMQNALKAGATVEEILEVMEIASMMGMQSARLGLPILREEVLARGAALPAAENA